MTNRRRYVSSLTICASFAIAILATAFEKLALDLAWLWVTAMAVMVGAVIATAFLASPKKAERASRQHQVIPKSAGLAKFMTVEESRPSLENVDWGSEAYQLAQLNKTYALEAMRWRPEK